MRHLIITKHLILFIILSMVACDRSPSLNNPSQLRTLYGESNIKLMSAAEKSASRSARAVGNLMQTATEPNTQQKFAFPRCSGMAIAKNLVLTAGHCNVPNLVFDTHQIAKAPAPEQLSFYVLGDRIRLMFEGELIDLATMATEQPLLGTPVYIDTKADFAIYRAPDQADFIDARHLGSLKTSDGLHLYGHTNGIPFSVATECNGLMRADGKYFMHNCDAMEGTSGGLVTDAADLPIALHLKGPALNSGVFYSQHQNRSEMPEDLVVGSGCVGTVPAESYDVEDDQSQNETCLERYSFNLSLPFAVIWSRLETSAPQLHAEIFGIKE